MSERPHLPEDSTEPDQPGNASPPTSDPARSTRRAAPGKTLDSLLDALSGGSLTERLSAPPAPAAPAPSAAPASGAADGGAPPRAGGLSDLLSALGGPDPVTPSDAAPDSLDPDDDPFAALTAPTTPVRVEDPVIAARARERLATRSEASDTERLALLGEADPATRATTPGDGPRASSLGSLPVGRARAAGEGASERGQSGGASRGAFDARAAQAAAEAAAREAVAAEDDPFAALLPSVEPAQVAPATTEPVSIESASAAPAPNEVAPIEVAQIEIAPNEPAPIEPTPIKEVGMARGESAPPTPPPPARPADPSAASTSEASAQAPGETAATDPRWTRTGRRPATRSNFMNTPEIALPQRPVVPAAAQPAAPINELRASSGDGETRITIRTASERRLERVRGAKGGGWTRRREALRNFWDGPLGWRGHELEDGVIARAVTLRMGLFYLLLFLAINVTTLGGAAALLPDRPFDAALAAQSAWSRGVVELVTTDRTVTLASGQTSSTREIREIREGYLAFARALDAVLADGADPSSLTPYATERARMQVQAYLEAARKRGYTAIRLPEVILVARAFGASALTNPSGVTGVEGAVNGPFEILYQGSTGSAGASVSRMDLFLVRSSSGRWLVDSFNLGN